MMKINMTIIFALLFLFLSNLTFTNGISIGSSVEDLVKCSKYEFEERVLEKLVRMEHAIEINQNKMNLWEIKIEKHLKTINEEFQTKMTTFDERMDDKLKRFDKAEALREATADAHLKTLNEDIDKRVISFADNIDENFQKLDEKEVQREELFQRMIDNMSVKLKDEEMAYVKLVDNFTDDSEILFKNLNERYNNLTKDIDKNTQLKNELFSDIVRNMNASFQTLIEDNGVKTETQQKSVTDTLHNLRSEFELLSKELRKDQTNISLLLIDKNTQLKKELFTDIVKNMNTSFQTLIEDNEVKTETQQKSVTDTLHNLRSEFELLSKELRKDQTNIDKNTQLKNELFSDIVRNMNASFQTLIEDNEVRTETQQKSVTDALHNLKSEFELLSKELRKDQTSMNQTLSKHNNQIGIIKDLPLRRDCTAIKTITNTSVSGVYEINPEDNAKTKVYCDMTTDGGGWTVLQRHSGSSVDFQRTWEEYEKGFGDPNGDYWLGNKLLHVMTSRHKYELRIVLTDTKKNLWYAVYKTFRIGDSSSKYKLTIGEYSGNAVDNMSYQDGMKFSTKDQDNDEKYGVHCATESRFGPWWHKACCDSALNRKYSKGPYWYGRKTLKSVMMIRRL